MSRAFAVVAVVAALALAAFAVARGTWAVGGSDSSCYGLMAKAFSAGQLQPSSALALDAPWPNAAITFAPGGFKPGLTPEVAMPICAPGMSVLMAPLAMAFGQDAIFWLTPIAAAALVLAAFALGTQLAGGLAGATAAILTATSPIVLYQSVQPMNDIVTAALWLGALALVRRHVLCGILIGLAILVRPNLAPLGLPEALGVNCFAGSGTRWKTRMFGLGGIPEDPATGSAAGPLAVHLARHGRIGFGEEIEITQGVEIGRPSKLFAVVHGSVDAIERVEVGGSAVTVAHGEFRLRET